MLLQKAVKTGTHLWTSKQPEPSEASVPTHGRSLARKEGGAEQRKGQDTVVHRKVLSRASDMSALRSLK